MKHLVQSIDMLQKLIKPNDNQVFILDIDSTLLTTHQRNQTILNKFIENFKQEFPEDCANLKIVQCQLGDYGLTSSLDRASFQPVNEKSRIKLDEFWHDCFFSNDFLFADVPTEGAVEWVQNLKEKGIAFVYLTARHQAKMWKGTLSSLANMGFPISEDILFLKENLDDTDEVYKTKTLHKISNELSHKEIWLIDNEPVVLHQVLNDHPHIQLVWFESTHSGRMQPPSQALAIKSFTFVP